jgi:hypothetical protein
MSDVLGLVIIAMIVVISLYAIYRISENLKRLDSKQKFDSKSTGQERGCPESRTKFANADKAESGGTRMGKPVQTQLRCVGGVSASLFSRRPRNDL